MATRKKPPHPPQDPAPDDAPLASGRPAGAAEPGAEPVTGGTAESATSATSATALAAAAKPAGGQSPRFHFFVIDTGWKTESGQVLRENFHMIRIFQNNDPLYVLSREQSIALVRANPDLIGKDPIILVHDLHAQGGRGESGYHGFRLCLGLIKEGPQALAALQKFLRFVQHHRHSENIEKHIREQLHRKGLESIIEVVRESASTLME